MCSHFIVGNNLFCFFKMSLCFFWTRVHFKGAVNFSKILRRVAHKGVEGVEEGVSDRFRTFWGSLDKKGWGQYFKVGMIPWRTLRDNVLLQNVFTFFHDKYPLYLKDVFNKSCISQASETLL